ncbi:MAG: hypothetical protein M0004_17110 [Actinomycetota bacterium]|nr:hypothetical protein [Actinomycetota bacterium]
MLVVVLLIVWVVALAPFALRKRHEWARGASINRFGEQRRAFRTRYAAYALPVTPAGRALEDDDPAAREARRDALRVERQRIRRLRARRRVVLTRLCLGVVGSFVLGAIPPLHALWDLSFVGMFAAIAYGAAIVRLARDEEYRLNRPVHPVVAPPARQEARPGGVVVPLRPVRPAFVIVEATS